MSDEEETADSEQSTSSDNESTGKNKQEPNLENNYQRRKKKKSERMNPTERKDLSEALEHLVAAGNYYRHQTWRIQEHGKRARGEVDHEARKRSREEENSSDDEESSDSDSSSQDHVPPSSSQAAAPKGGVLDLHAEDIRLYGLAGFQCKAWPHPNKQETSLKFKKARDEEWDHEYGDNIDPLVFSPTQLSVQVPNDPEEVKKVATTDLDYDQKVFTLDQKIAPRFLVMRCWERAMHAASSTMVVQDETENEVEPTESDNTGVAEFQSSNDKAREKCRRLKIKLQRNSPWNCPVCQLSFDSKKWLEEHFYGRENYRGCCWTLIQEKQRQLIDQTLQNEVKTQAERLVRWVLSQSQNKDRPEAIDGRQGLFDWQHVLETMEHALSSSQFQLASGMEVSTGYFDETVELEKEKPPAVINKQLLHAVTRRLIDRYAKVPK